jgi:hypothetical protein
MMPSPIIPRPIGISGSGTIQSLDVKPKDPAPGSSDLRGHGRIPPDVVGIDHEPDLIGGKPLRDRSGLGQRVDHRPVRHEHRMQRLNAR